MIQQHHQSLYALENIDISLRDHTGMTMAINSEDIPKVREMVLKFRRQLLKELAKSEKKDAVYQLNISFYPQTGRDQE